MIFDVYCFTWMLTIAQRPAAHSPAHPQPAARQHPQLAHYRSFESKNISNSMNFSSHMNNANAVERTTM